MKNLTTGAYGPAIGGGYKKDMPDAINKLADIAMYYSKIRKNEVTIYDAIETLLYYNTTDGKYKEDPPGLADIKERMGFDKIRKILRG